MGGLVLVRGKFSAPSFLFPPSFFLLFFVEGEGEAKDDDVMLTGA